MPEFQETSGRSPAPSGRPGTGPDLASAARGELARARHRARALLAETRREAEALARARVEAAFALGREEGLARGLAEGREAASEQTLSEVREDIGRAAAVLVAAGERVQAAREAVRAEAEAGVVRLAAAIGTKLARRDIATRTPEAAMEALREALRLAADRAELRVLVSPADLVALEAARDALREEYPGIIRVAFEPDAGVLPGGCRVVTASCTVDATLETRAERIAELLAGPASGEEAA